ncbi:sulfurase [Alphaproteobacteria bacterium]|nr:sulfurase [Alphaproteobacteria bacterium]
MGVVKKINITNESGANTFYVENAYLESGMGIVGDRYYNNFKHPREQVTLIEEEIIENFKNKIDRKIDGKDFRRNIITEGIELTKFINKKIKIGNEVILKIHEICQPCIYLQNKLKIENLIKLLVNKSGIQTEIIASGKININDRIVILD